MTPDKVCFRRGKQGRFEKKLQAMKKIAIETPLLPSQPHANGQMSSRVSIQTFAHQGL